MTDQGQNANMEPGERAATVVLERLLVPGHQDGFWDELRTQMETADRQVDKTPWFESKTGRRLLSVAAIALILLAGAALVTNWPDRDRTQSIDTGPSPTSVPDPAVTSTSLSTSTSADSLPVDVGDAITKSQVRGASSEWLYSDMVVWSDEKFVAANNSVDQPAHWVSTDGIDWESRDGSSPVVAIPHACPDGFSCAVEPAETRIPFHFAAPRYEVLARTGSVVLLEASVRYDMDQQEVFPPSGEELQQPGPVLHPDLLAAAASADPCFQEIHDRPGQPRGLGEEGDAAHISGWQWGETAEPIVRLTCQQGGHTARFQLNLREYLTEEQVQRLYFNGVDTELWVETLGSGPQRVPDPPQTTYRIDGPTGDDLVTDMSVASSGDRLWAVDEGTLVSSIDGLLWNERPLPIGRLSTGELQLNNVLAAPGGNLALWLVDGDVAWPESGWVTISHDDGATWTEPTESPAMPLSVGPAGAATVIDGTGEAGSPALLLFNDGRLVFSKELPNGAVWPSATVGEDRILVQADSLDIYRIDGSLMHQTTYVPGEDNRPVLVLVAVLVVGCIASAAILRRRRSRVSVSGVTQPPGEFR